MEFGWLNYPSSNVSPPGKMSFKDVCSHQGCLDKCCFLECFLRWHVGHAGWSHRQVSFAPKSGGAGGTWQKFAPKNSFLGVQVNSPHYITDKDVLFSKTAVSLKMEKLNSSFLLFGAPPLH